MARKSRNTESDYAYRVFISYSHGGRIDAIMEQLRTHLKRLGTHPVCDINITAGTPFSEEIRRMIATAHVFMPIVTQHSIAGPSSGDGNPPTIGPWVNQEIGYAMGLGVPMIPIAIGDLPRGMAESIQALQLDESLSGLEEKLTRRNLDVVVMASRHTMQASYVCTEGLYRRTDLLAGKAEELLMRGVYARVRQRSAFSSFSLPDVPSRHSKWKTRDGKNPRDIDIRDRLRAERQIMETHASAAGCDLILDPYVAVPSPQGDRIDEKGLPPKHDINGMRLRLKLLLEFLESMPADMVHVGIQRGKIESSLAIVGDWFTMEAVVPHYGVGYRHSTFTEHGPTVLRKIEEFDDELEQVLRDQNVAPEESRDYAIAEISKILVRTEN